MRGLIKKGVILLTFVCLFNWSTFFLKGRLVVQAISQKAVGFVLEKQTEDYQVLASEHFVLKYTKRDQELAPLVLQLAEDYYGQIGELLGLPRPKEAPLLVLYPDLETLRAGMGWGEKSAVGVYWAGSIRLLSPRVWSGADEMVAFAREGPLAHELTHYYVDLVTKGNYPRWLSEGLAQVVEEKITGFTLPRVKGKIYALAELKRLFDQPGKEYLAYGQARDAVNYLWTCYGIDKMTVLLTRLGEGETLKQALKGTYGLSRKQLEHELGWGRSRDEVLFTDE